MLGVNNKHADALVTLSLKTDFLDGAVDVRNIKKTLQASVADLFPSDPFDQKDLRNSIIQKFASANLDCGCKGLISLLSLANSIIEEIVECQIEPYP